MIFYNYSYFLFIFIHIILCIKKDYQENIIYNNLYFNDLFYTKNFKIIYISSRCYFNGCLFGFFSNNFIYLFRIVNIHFIKYIFDIIILFLHILYIFSKLSNYSIRYYDILSIYSFHMGYLNLKE